MLGCAGQVAIPGVFAVLLHGRWTAQSISGALGVVPLGVVPLLATGALLLLARALRTTQTLASLPTSGLTPHPAP